MIQVPYDPERKCDAGFSKVISLIRIAIAKKDDDFLTLCVGPTGTGKSSLMLHAMDEYLGEKSSITYVGLNRASFANALKKCKGEQRPRFCANDEANISKRDALTKFNKEMLDLYFSIRGLNIWHWWSNPSVDMIDKPFIEERIKGLIYISTKDIVRPRIYYYFRKVDLLKIWKKYSSLKLDLLAKVKREYAYYRGWFKKYDGPLWKEYLEKKDTRMDEKVDEFHEKYGDHGNISRKEIIALTGLSAQTIRSYTKELPQEVCSRNAAGIFQFKRDSIPLIVEIAENRRKKAWRKTNAPMD